MPFKLDSHRTFTNPLASYIVIFHIMILILHFKSPYVVILDVFTGDTRIEKFSEDKHHLNKDSQIFVPVVTQVFPKSHSPYSLLRK